MSKDFTFRVTPKKAAEKPQTIPMSLESTLSFTKRECPACRETKSFRSDQKTCGCKGTNPQLAEPVLQEGNKIQGDNWEISLPKTRIHTLDQLLKFCEVDLRIWEVSHFTCNKWEMGYVNKDSGKAETEQLYQIKASLKRKRNIVAAQKEIEQLLELATARMPEPKLAKKLTGKKGGMLEINLTDHHFGKLAWQLETLRSNYDVKIATQVFNRALHTLLERSPFATYEEIWFVVGNDLFNADDTQGRTTSGTQVDSDVRIRKTYVTVRTLMVRAIEMLRHLADKVKVVVVPGNHDFNTTWHLGDSLELYFSKHPDVEVDNTPSQRKYHRYGATLIGYTHGDKGKQKDLPLLMTVEARELYGETLFHEWHTGHTHQTSTSEHHGIRIRVLPALCPPDKWHAEMGFVGNLRSSEAFVWDKAQGLIGIVIFTDNDDLIEKASTVPTAVKEE